MAHRTILTERQRAALFDLPTDEAEMLRHYTLADDDLDHIRGRRRPENRIGFALQLCALRYPERLLSNGEVIPEKLLRFTGPQLGIQLGQSLEVQFFGQACHWIRAQIGTTVQPHAPTPRP